MSKKPGVEDSTQTSSSKYVAPRPLSKWEKERRKRRILGIIISIVIIGVLISGGIVGYVHLYKPWHQPIVRVNEDVYDMSYFVKMLRFYGAGSNYSQDIQLANYVAQAIRDNALIKQKAEELGVSVTADEINEELKNRGGFDPDSEDEKEFNQRVEEALAENKLSVADFKNMIIEPILLQTKVKDGIGDIEYPVDSTYEQVQVKAILLGTYEEAIQVRDSEWNEDIDQLVEDYSASNYYPDDNEGWLPLGIESSVFEDYAFDEANEDAGVSDPIQDTTYWTEGGYWLVMVYEPEEEEEHEDDGLYIKAILLDSNEKALEYKGDIEGGKEFAEVAEEYSLDSGSKEDGGDMGWLSLDDIDTQFGEDNGDIIEGLAVDAVSDPLDDENVSKQSGYWLIEVLGSEERELCETHRDTFVSEAYNEWLEAERDSEENTISIYLDGDVGYERILWALESIYEE